MQNALLARVAAVAIAAAIGLSSAGCSPRTPPAPPPPAAAEPKADPEHELALRIVKASTEVETYRIDGMPDYEVMRHRDDPRYKDRFLGDWVIERRGPVEGRDFAERLAAFLEGGENFTPPTSENQKACVFNPGVAFRLRSGDEHTDVIVCFACRQLAVETSKGRLRIPSVNFDPGYGRLGALAKEAFPEDPEIKAL